MRIRDTKRNKKFFEDRTGGDVLGRMLSKMPSSMEGLTDQEINMQDAGWSVNDLYFLRAAQTDSDLIPNKGAEWSGGEVYQRLRKMQMQRQLDMLRRRQIQR